MVNEYALLDTNGIVLNKIVADAEVIEELKKNIDDPDVDTGTLSFSSAVDVTGLPVEIGHKRGADGKFARPPLTQAQKDAELTRQAREAEVVAQFEQRQNDLARLEVLRTKVGPGKAGLSPAERDEKDLLIASLQLKPV